MNPWIDVLLHCPLFSQMTEQDLEHIIHCFSLTPSVHPADEYIITTGSQVNSIYIVLKGTVEIIKETYAGNRHIIVNLGPSQIFAEGIVCTKQRISPVTVRTKEETILYRFPYVKLMTSCDKACSFHTKLIFNMMLLLGSKNYQLNHKIELLMIKGMREKIATFLLQEHQINQSLDFTIGMNRNELADYLNVSRPSMSRELGRMQEEGLITYHKNSFQLLDLSGLQQCIEKDG